MARTKRDSGQALQQDGRLLNSNETGILRHPSHLRPDQARYAVHDRVGQSKEYGDLLA